MTKSDLLNGGIYIIETVTGLYLKVIGSIITDGKEWSTLDVYYDDLSLASSNLPDWRISKILQIHLNVQLPF